MEQVVTGWRRYMSVQPPLTILMFAQAISSNILTDFIVYRVCKITLNINKTECLLLHENSSSAEALKIYEQVQPETSLILMTKSFIESIFPTFLSLFLGPWSDKNGRKPLIVAGYIGTICYISDISNEEDRAWQLAWMDALIFIGVIIGILIGPIVFRAYGYTIVFGCANLCCILAGLYICFLVPDTIYSTNLITLSSLFDVNLVKELISTCTKKRDRFNRHIVWCCIITISLLVIISQGEMTIQFLFASARLGWDVNKYSIYVVTDIMLTIFGIILGVKVLTTCGGFPEEAAAVLSLLSSLSSSLVKSFTWKSWHMYLSTIVGAFSGIASPMLRAILSKSVPPEDSGKIFSLTLSIETLTPLVGVSLYGVIYSHFMPPLYPLPVWLVSVGIYIIAILLLINIRIQNGKCNSSRYTPLTQDNEILT
ncbi:putative peptidoglycan muropeptide transporter SLC46 isoform X2 [Ptiloglossa arizonensis]|uniref:putative peptidoglycan muropeptide transporter SLC46 isoform X2 n=1 Tax=Ptiloglossa arizonensis TaxID=3350558 RepID=UPI003F9F4CEA